MRLSAPIAALENEALGSRLPSEVADPLQQVATHLASIFLGQKNACILSWSRRLSMFQTPLSDLLRKDAINRVRAEGKAEGELTATHTMLLKIVQGCLGHIPSPVKERIESCQDVAALESCVPALVKATNEEEAVAALASLAKAGATEKNGKG